MHRDKDICLNIFWNNNIDSTQKFRQFSLFLFFSDQLYRFSQTMDASLRTMDDDLSKFLRWCFVIVGWKLLLSEIIWGLQVQSQLQVRITKNTYYNLTLDIVNRIGTINPCGLNKEFSLRFWVDSWVWHETPEEGQRKYLSKCFEYNNKDVVYRPNILRNKNRWYFLTSFEDPWIRMYTKS